MVWSIPLTHIDIRYFPARDTSLGPDASAHTSEACPEINKHGMKSCMYVYMYVCMKECVCKCMYVRMYTCAFIYICMYEFTVCMNVLVNVCMYVFVNECVYVNANVC